MYKRPIPRPSRNPVLDDVPPCVSACLPHGIVIDQISARPPKKEPYRPIWQPSEHPPKPLLKKEYVFHANIYAVYQKFCPHRPPLKPLVDAMRLDGFTEERVRKMRKFYADMNRTAEKRQEALDKTFGKITTKTKTVKKVVKIVKKRNVDGV